MLSPGLPAPPFTSSRISFRTGSGKERLVQRRRRSSNSLKGMVELVDFLTNWKDRRSSDGPPSIRSWIFSRIRSMALSFLMFVIGAVRSRSLFLPLPKYFRNSSYETSPSPSTSILSTRISNCFVSINMFMPYSSLRSSCGLSVPSPSTSARLKA